MSEPGQSALAARLRRAITGGGPISVASYMAQANAHYYALKDPFGVAGDFITAPEISQMFGEMAGLWCADMWLRAGRPPGVRYVEPGPGRGTLARDALRAMARFGLVPRVHFIETSPLLRAAQARLVPDAHWHDSVSSIPGDAPILLVANEFLDALPVRQLVQTPEGWRERMVDCINGRFVPVAGTLPMDAAVPEARRQAETGVILETSPAATAAVAEVARALLMAGGAALFIDYGDPAPRFGSTLQAVHRHGMVDPFTNPGAADLTAWVDFASARAVAEAEGACWLGTVEQGPWLKALGIETRATALASAAPDQAEAVAAALARLTAVDQMGKIFKVMGLASPSWPAGAGF